MQHEKLVRDYVSVTQEKAFEHLKLEDPFENLLTLVEIMQSMIQNNDIIDNKFKQQFEFLHKSYMYYYTLLAEE